MSSKKEDSDEPVTTWVNSTCISFVTWDPAQKTCTIEFTEGGSVEYTSLPQKEVEALITASSAGAYYNTRIRGKYE